jgi:hypothetical protein
VAAEMPRMTRPGRLVGMYGTIWPAMSTPAGDWRVNGTARLKNLRQIRGFLTAINTRDGMASLNSEF